MSEDLVAAVCLYWLLRGQLGRVARLVALIEASGGLRPSARTQAFVGLVDRLKALLREMGRQPAQPAGTSVRQLEVLGRLIRALEGQYRDLARLELELKTLAASGSPLLGLPAVKAALGHVLEGLPRSLANTRRVLAKLEAKQRQLAHAWRGRLQ